MKMILRAFGVIIFTVGIGMIVLPAISNQYYDRKYDELKVEVEDSMLAAICMNALEALDVTLPESSVAPMRFEVIKRSDPVDAIDEIAITLPGMDDSAFEETVVEDELRKIDSMIDKITSTENNEEEVVERVYTKAERDNYISSIMPVEGILIIDAIDLDMLVIEDATQKHLDFSISSLDNTPKPVEARNYAIAGHRSLKYGKDFNRLNELMMGDVITFKDLAGKSYTYEVYDFSIVHETDLSVLKDGGFSEITLITCDPIGAKDPENRLIVKGKLIE